MSELYLRFYRMKQHLPKPIFFIIALGMAACLATYWWLDTGDFDTGLGVFFSVLLACLPLPWLLSRPLALWRAAQQARPHGIELADRSVLTELADAEILVVSRRGTITSGHPYLAETTPEGTSRASLLSMAAAAERQATHPIGRAIVQFADKHQLKQPQPMMANELPGQGVESMIQRITVRVGRPEWLQREGIRLDAAHLTRIDQLSARGRQPILVTYDSYLRGTLVFDDDISRDTIAAIHHLQDQGLALYILTADNQRLANATQKKTQADKAIGELTPAAKAQEVQNLRLAGQTVAVLVNEEKDALMLERADAPLRNLTLPQVATLLPLSRKASHIIRQNHKFAIVATILMLLPASGFLHVFGGPFLSPLIAVIILVVTTLLIFINSLRT